MLNLSDPVQLFLDNFDTVANGNALLLKKTLPKDFGDVKKFLHDWFNSKDFAQTVLQASSSTVPYQFWKSSEQVELQKKDWQFFKNFYQQLLTSPLSFYHQQLAEQPAKELIDNFTQALQLDQSWQFYQLSPTVPLELNSTADGVIYIDEQGRHLQNVPSNRIIRTAAIQADGKIIISSYSGGSYFLMRMQPNGQIDPSFATPIKANDAIDAISIQADGKILVAGAFTKFCDYECNGLIRLNTDGSIDEDFKIGSGIDGTIYSILIQPDGKIIIGGVFEHYNSVPKKGLARLNADGSLDENFELGLKIIYGLVFAALFQTDGKLLVAGSFVEGYQKSRNLLIRLNTDGSLDQSFKICTFNDQTTTHALALQTDGKIIVGGSFTQLNDLPQNKIARLNSDGSLDQSFNVGAGVSIHEIHDNHLVDSIAVQEDGKILVGGKFSTFNHKTINHLAKLNADGSSDASFNAQISAGGNVRKILLTTDQKTFIVGYFPPVYKSYFEGLGFDSAMVFFKDQQLYFLFPKK